MSQAIVPHDMLPENFEMLQYDGIKYLDQSNVSQFTQKIPFQARVVDPIWTKIIQLYIPWLWEFFLEILWHDGAKITLWSNMGPIWPKITQLVLNAQEIFKNILA